MLNVLRVSKNAQSTAKVGEMLWRRLFQLIAVGITLVNDRSALAEIVKI